MVEPSKKPQPEENKGDSNLQVGQVKIIKNKYTRNVASPFLSEQRDWTEEEHFKLSPELLKGIVDGNEFVKPSKIQAVAIPLIVEQPLNNLIAQSKNGSGKTGAFVIGSLLRVDPADKKTQVVTICHTRELAKQIYTVYKNISEYTDLNITNLVDGSGDGQVVVTTLGSLHKQLQLRGGKKIDISGLKLIVVDEADFFFSDDNNFNELKTVQEKHFNSIPGLQYALFSATYAEEVKLKIGYIIKEARQISIKKREQQQLNHIRQYYYKCEPRKKPEFLMEVLDKIPMSQTIIFVNTKQYAEILLSILRKNKYKVNIIFGQMSFEERDEYIQKFRDREIQVVITTNMLARGLDVPEVQIVINFDVPTVRNLITKKVEPDCENYLHRIGRAGRFGVPGLALTIYDREEDEQNFMGIVDFYKMQDKVEKLRDKEQMQEVVEYGSPTKRVKLFLMFSQGQVWSSTTVWGKCLKQ